MPRLILILLLPVAALLQGCPAAFVVAQAVPAAMGSVAMANVQNRDPFFEHAPVKTGGADDDIAALGTKIRRAECGDPESQYWLAARLNNGFNAAPDHVEAYKWYRLAEMGGFSAAGPRVATLGATMPEPEVAKARALADAWAPATENCPAES